MSSPTPNSSIDTEFEIWLKSQISQLSIDTLKSSVITCTACGEVSGTYMIEYQGNRSRYSPGDAYAFLKFIAETQPIASLPEPYKTLPNSR